MMNIAIHADATLRPAMLFTEECLEADSVEIDLGDIAFCHGPPKLEVRVENEEVRKCDLPLRSFRYLKPSSAKERYKSFQRSRKQMRKQSELRKFLDHHKFQSVDHKVPLQPSGELISPIHLAAHLGRPHLLRLILNHGVDPEQKSSHGRTALDMAKGINKDAMREVIELLTNPVQTWSVRNFFEHMGIELPLKHKVPKLERSAEASTDGSKICGKRYSEVIVRTVEL